MWPLGDARPLAVSILALLACVLSDVLAREEITDTNNLELSRQDETASDGNLPTSDDFVGGVKFELYTRENPDEPVHIDIYGGKRSLKYFKRKRPTKIGIHGWLTDLVGMRSMWLTFLDTDDVNFILVNWTEVDSVLYPSSRSKVPFIARRLSSLLDFLSGEQRVDLRAVHLIGHSLGAHISGIAGMLVQQGDRQIGRITGFDPAGPLFDEDPAQRLDPSDAAFVDVIHTCGNILGYSEPLGHVDFYPNQGKCSQPGCMIADLTTGSCSHDRGYDYFRESLVNASSFLSWPCAGYGDIARPVSDPAEAVPMGIACPRTVRGAFCLNTRSSSPYGLGPDGSGPAPAPSNRNALRSTSPARQPHHLPQYVESTIRRRYFAHGYQQYQPFRRVRSKF